MDRLDIRRLVATNFGGLQNRTVVLPDDPFVVLHGPNESVSLDNLERGVATLIRILEALDRQEAAASERGDG